ncbi:MAG: DUF502 domain-containing protein [Pseudomonadota bacterium]|nr:DUF502 domain-containing protein [Pseudomonadota bacterium]
MSKKIKQIFIAGLLVAIPIGLTLYVLVFLIGIMDDLLRIIPRRIHPDAILGFHVPGLGIIFVVVLIFAAGLMMKSYLGNRIVQIGEAVFHRIPIIRGIYDGTKQVMERMFVHNNRSFKKTVLVEFPRAGVFTLGFVTGPAHRWIGAAAGRPCTNVFVPTTPNPTSGYLLAIPDEELREIDMAVEEALTYIVSCGLVQASSLEMKPRGTAAGQKTY